MSLWVDKYRPKSLDELDYHDQTTELLRTMVKSGDIPHLLFYGPSGAGKRTRVMAALRALYGPSLDKVKIDLKTFEAASGKKLEIHLMSSLYHVEINPSDVGYYDRVVVQQIIKEIAQTQQVTPNSPREYKVVILNEADSLTREAQQALRRTMEKYMSNLRIFLVANHLGKIIEPLQSRCFLVRVPCPEPSKVISLLKDIANREGVQAPLEMLSRIVTYSEGNLRKALLCLEATKAKRYPFADTGHPLEQTDWEECITALAHYILQEQSPSRLLACREKLYELLTHCIPASIILKKLSLTLIDNVESPIKRSIMRETAFYEHRLTQGTKAIFHLEAFVAKFMSLYKRYLLSLSV